MMSPLQIPASCAGESSSTLLTKAPVGILYISIASVVRFARLTPRYPFLLLSTFSLVSRFISSSRIGFALEIGMAYPIPSTALSAYFAELMPISSPFIFKSAPPLLPGLIAASVWISPVLFVPSSVEIVRFNALIQPDVTD